MYIEMGSGEVGGSGGNRWRSIVSGFKYTKSASSLHVTFERIYAPDFIT